MCDHNLAEKHELREMTQETLDIHKKIKDFWITRIDHEKHVDHADRICNSNESFQGESPFGVDEESSNYDLESINKEDGVEKDKDNGDEFNLEGLRLKRQFLNFLEFTVTDDQDLDTKSQQQILTDKLFANDHKHFAH